MSAPDTLNLKRQLANTAHTIYINSWTFLWLKQAHAKTLPCMYNFFCLYIERTITRFTYKQGMFGNRHTKPRWWRWGGCSPLHPDYLCFKFFILWLCRHNCTLGLSLFFLVLLLLPSLHFLLCHHVARMHPSWWCWACPPGCCGVRVSSLLASSFLASRPPKVGSKILDVYIALARFLGSFWAGAFYPSYLFAFQLFVLFVNFKGNFYSFHFLYSSFAFAF